jgi:hypothetical protein
VRKFGKKIPGSDAGHRMATFWKTINAGNVPSLQERIGKKSSEDFGKPVL